MWRSGGGGVGGFEGGVEGVGERVGFAGVGGDFDQLETRHDLDFLFVGEAAVEIEIA